MYQHSLISNKPASKVIKNLKFSNKRAIVFLGLSTSNVSRLNVPEIKPLVGERGGSVVECRTPEREVGGSKPTAAVLCPWARHFTPRKYWLITQEAVAPSRHDWKIVDWDVKPQHKQNKPLVVFKHVLVTKEQASMETSLSHFNSLEYFSNTQGPLIPH